MAATKLKYNLYYQYKKKGKKNMKLCHIIELDAALAWINSDGLGLVTFFKMVIISITSLKIFTK